MNGRFTRSQIVLFETLGQVRGLACIEMTNFLAVKYVDEEHRASQELLRRPVAPEGRRGDLYPSALRARQRKLYTRMPERRSFRYNVGVLLIVVPSNLR
jgi:hypothetical protein